MKILELQKLAFNDFYGLRTRKNNFLSKLCNLDLGMKKELLNLKMVDIGRLKSKNLTGSK